jgi:hypothetical protein
MGMVAVCIEHDLLGKVNELRNKVGAPSTNEGYLILPQIRIRDNNKLSASRVRVRNYADYLLDKEFSNPADAVVEIIESLYRIAQANISIQELKGKS